MCIPKPKRAGGEDKNYGTHGNTRGKEFGMHKLRALERSKKHTREKVRGTHKQTHGNARRNAFLPKS